MIKLNDDLIFLLDVFCDTFCYFGTPISSVLHYTRVYGKEVFWHYLNLICFTYFWRISWGEVTNNGFKHLHDPWFIVTNSFQTVLYQLENMMQSFFAMHVISLFSFFNVYIPSIVAINKKHLFAFLHCWGNLTQMGTLFTYRFPCWNSGFELLRATKKRLWDYISSGTKNDIRRDRWEMER